MAPVVVRVACLLAVAAGMINDVHIEFGKVDVFEIVWSFEFGEGGKMDLSGQTWIPSPAPNATVQMMVCSATSLVQVRSMRIEDVCAPPVFNAAACVWQDVMAYERNPIQMSITTPTKVRRVSLSPRSSATQRHLTSLRCVRIGTTCCN